MAIKSPVRTTALAIVLSVELFLANSILSPVQAQSNPQTHQSLSGKNATDPGQSSESLLSQSENQLPSTHWNQYQPPTEGQGSGVPGRREGGATRSLNPKCPNVTALVPESVSGATLEPQPTLLFYVDAPLNHKVEFVLTDDTEHEFISTFDLKTANAGIVSISLAALRNLTPLEVGKYYRWDLTVKCDPKTLEGAMNVYGWVKRIALNPQTMGQLAQAALPSRFSIYNQELLWYDALATLAELRHSNPSDVNFTRQWETLLKDVNLDEILGQPLIQTQILSSLSDTPNAP